MNDEETDGNWKLRVLLDLLSHDINNHIHGSTGYMDLLEQTIPDDPMLKRFLGNSMSELKAISPLVDNVRLLVNISSEKFEAEEVDLAGTLQNAIESASYQNDRKKLNVDSGIDKGEITLAADRFLKEAFIQILTNSMNGDTSEEVHIKVEHTLSNGHVVLSFSDNGKGIPEDRKEGIFTRFRRSIEEGDVKGKGMGLSVVNEVIHRYEGSVKIVNRVKEDHTQGTKVVLEIPLFG